jgi:hypothetical protein
MKSPKGKTPARRRGSSTQARSKSQKTYQDTVRQKCVPGQKREQLRLVFEKRHRTPSPKNKPRQGSLCGGRSGVGRDWLMPSVLAQQTRITRCAAPCHPGSGHILPQPQSQIITTSYSLGAPLPISCGAPALSYKINLDSCAVAGAVPPVSALDIHPCNCGPDPQSQRTAVGKAEKGASNGW